MFATLSEAEEGLEIDYINNDMPFDVGAADHHSTPQRPATAIDENPLSPIFQCSPAKEARPLASSVGDLVQEFVANFKNCMAHRLRHQLLAHLLNITIVESKGLDFFKFVNADFLSSSLSGMKTLFMNSKQNLIFYLSKCFEGPSPRMPINRMPYGLLDYNIRFFAKGSTQNLGIEEHYVSWLATMFSHFGHKWLRLHWGPAWQYEVQANDETEDSLLSASCSREAGSAGAESIEECSVGEGSVGEESVGADLVEQIDIIQSALQESSLCLNDLDWAIDTLDDINPESTVLENSASSCEGVVRVPHLWTHVSGSQQWDMEMGIDGFTRNGEGSWHKTHCSLLEKNSRYV